MVFVLGFLFGAMFVLAAECLTLYLAVVRLCRKTGKTADPSRETSDLISEQWLDSACNKKGIIWFLDFENATKASLLESPTGGAKEQKAKKNAVQVQPVKKYAKIRDHLLIVSDFDGSEVIIKLLNYTVLTVSSSNSSSKKWAKRYPIRLEINNSSANEGRKTVYLYFDSSWEKESWCKALRLASSNDSKLIIWYEQISKEFNHYLTSFTTEFPSFLKPSAIHGENTEKIIRVDGPSTYSKAYIFLKKLAKKASKGGEERRMNLTLSSSIRDARKISEKPVSLNDVPLAEGCEKSLLEDKSSSGSFQDVMQLGNNGMYSIISNTVSGDNGTLCWNLLFSRLFFDAKRSPEICCFVKNHIQKTLSNMRIPSYIGGLTCSNLNIGILPPYIHKIRVLPMDLTEVWAVEVDIEYSGGLLLDIETRIEVGEPELAEEIIIASSDPDFNGDTSKILEGIEIYSNQISSSAGLTDQLEKGSDVGEADSHKQGKNLSQASVGKPKWKAILHTIAEQVSQVPLSLSIRIASLRGTLRLHIRPPPSDQLWFAFTAMPDIDWQLESSVGDRRITSSHIALLIGNRFKIAVRDSLVLPNCESITIPWMLAEKDDWAPQKAAPFIWTKYQEAMDTGSTGANDPNTKATSAIKSKSCSDIHSDDKTEKVKDVVYIQKALDDHLAKPSSLSFSSSSTSYNSDKRLAVFSHQSSGSSEESVASSVPLEEEMKPKKVGRRARMMDLGKKMSEKLDEKRRLIEERSRHIVEKMMENPKP